MKKPQLFCFIVLFFLSCSSEKGGASVVLARVGDLSITKRDLEKEYSNSRKTVIDTASFIEQWVSFALLLEEAKKEGFLKDAQLKHERDRFYEQLIVSSFVRTKTGTNIKINKDMVLLFYKQNKEMFVRNSDEAFVHHYQALQLNDARFIRKTLLKRNKKKLKEIESFRIESRAIKKGYLLSDLDRAVFKSKESIVGPVGALSTHHVFDVVRRYKKGSQKGIDACYDEIYQMLLKEKLAHASGRLLDSLKNNINIFINTN
jgi:hypothetical protein